MGIQISGRNVLLPGEDLNLSMFSGNSNLPTPPPPPNKITRSGSESLIWNLRFMRIITGRSILLPGFGFRIWGLRVRVPGFGIHKNQHQRYNPAPGDHDSGYEPPTTTCFFFFCVVQLQGEDLPPPAFPNHLIPHHLSTFQQNTMLEFWVSKLKFEVEGGHHQS